MYLQYLFIEKWQDVYPKGANAYSRRAEKYQPTIIT